MQATSVASALQLHALAEAEKAFQSSQIQWGTGLHAAELRAYSTAEPLMDQETDQAHSCPAWAPCGQPLLGQPFA